MSMFFVMPEDKLIIRMRGSREIMIVLQVDLTLAGYLPVVNVIPETYPDVYFDW